MDSLCSNCKKRKVEKALFSFNQTTRCTFCNKWFRANPIPFYPPKNFDKKLEQEKWEKADYEETLREQKLNISNSKIHTVSAKQSDFGENIKLLFQILFGIFILWMIFGGLFEKKNNSNSVYIDCTKESYKNSQYCNGEYENKVKEQDFNENNYYQTIVR